MRPVGDFYVELAARIAARTGSPRVRALHLPPPTDSDYNRRSLMLVGSVVRVKRRCGRRRSSLPGEALVELVLGCRLGVAVGGTRSGIGQVPQGRAAGGGDAGRRGRRAEMVSA